MANDGLEMHEFGEVQRISLLVDTMNGRVPMFFYGRKIDTDYQTNKAGNRHQRVTLYERWGKRVAYVEQWKDEGESRCSLQLVSDDCKTAVNALAEIFQREECPSVLIDKANAPGV